MPRIKLTLGELPPGLSTRPRNKEQHPGVPDLPKPRRLHAEVLSLRNAEIEARKEKEDLREDAIRRAAAIEDDMQMEDDEQASGQQWRDNVTHGETSSAAEDEHSAFESDDDSAYQPNESGEDEIELESDGEALREQPAKTQKRKKRQEGVRTAVQLARSNDVSPLELAGEKRKLPVEMEKSVNVKRSKKPEIGGIVADWQDRRGHSVASTTNQTGSTRARSAASSALSLTASAPTGADTTQDDSLKLATFADEPDDEERRTMVQFEEAVSSKVRRWQTELIPGKAKSQAPTPSISKSSGNRDGFKLVNMNERVTAIDITSTIPLSAQVGKRTTRTGTVTTKVRNSDIPEGMRDLWTKLVVPLARELAGTLRPWGSLDIDHIQSIIDRVYPQSGYVVRKGDVLYTLLSYRITDWRSSIGSCGTTLVEQLITDNKDVLVTKEKIREWVSYMLGDSNQRVPFHWRKWNDVKKSGKGVYEHELILATFATTHIAEIERIPANLRSKDRPVGALVLAIQAVERGLKLYATGEKLKSDTDLWFSEDNWGNVVRTEGGKAKHINRAGKYLNVINKWKPEKWSVIMDSARELYKEIQPTQKGQTAAQPIEVEEEEETYYIASGSDSD